MEIIVPKDIKNIKYHLIGVIFLILNYIRSMLLGYRTPRTFSISQIDLAIDYDFKIIENWIKYLNNYSKEPNPLKDKIILEIGIGPDLGTGLILLAMGVKKYIALDVNDLAKSTPAKFYEKLFYRLKDRDPNMRIDYLKVQLDRCNKGEDGSLNYIVDKDFKISKIRDKIDIVFSQAAFEHFTDIEKTLTELNSVVRKGGVLVTEIDMKTHTRWIRDRDPLNIYRYNKIFYNMFKFKGSPNRVRAFEYEELLERKGWVDILIEPITVVEDKYIEKVKPFLYKKFRQMESSEMQKLSIVLMANKR